MNHLTPIQLKKFNLNILYSQFTLPKICIIGGPNTGKTWLIYNIIQKLDELTSISDGIIVTPTDSHDKRYQNKFSFSYIHERFDMDIIKNVIKIKNENKDSQYLFIMDNCEAAKSKWLKDNKIKSILTSKNINYILTMQYAMYFEYRQYFDYVFILEESIQISRKRIYESYFKNMYNTFEEFEDIFIPNTQDYKCIVLDNKNKLIYYYKSEENNAPLQYLNTFDIIKYYKPFTIII
jgi:adenylate kinase family enzyme